METLASNYRMALEAKDKIIEDRDREIEALKQVISRLESERLTKDRDRTESHIQSDQLKASLAHSLTDRYTDSSFAYDGLESDDIFEYASLRRSRRKRRPKRPLDITEVVVRQPTQPSDPNQPRKRGRPRVKKEANDEEEVTEDQSVITEGSVVVNDGQINVTIEGVSGDDQTTDDQSSAVVGVRQRRKFPHPCDWPGCERSFRRPAFLRKHKRVHTGEKPFKCDFEGCAFASADLFCLRTHQMRHTGEKPFKCKVSGCGWSGRQQTSYDRHRRVVHGQQRGYQCDWPGCDRRYRDKHSLNYHRKSHTGQKDYMCSHPGCGKTFIGRSDMKKHESTHNAVKPYKCLWPGCGRSFVQKRYLALHNLKHTGERPYPCDWPGCEWRSFTPHEQAKHKKTHTGERPFPCDRCERRFADESNLKAHMRTVHEGQKNHECPFPGCGKRYTVRRTLLIHQMKAHPSMIVHQTSADESSLIDGDQTNGVFIEDEPNICHYPGCGKQYSLKRTLLLHQVKYHPNMTVQQTGAEETVITTCEDDDEEPEVTEAVQTIEEAIIIDGTTAQTITIKTN